jgi:hypothetical protein
VQHISKEKFMKHKPRNPLIAQALFRRAGAHEKTENAKRQNERLALQRQLRALRSSKPEDVFVCA